jgi:hypothetical protein
MESLFGAELVNDAQVPANIMRGSSGSWEKPREPDSFRRLFGRRPEREFAA